MSDNGTFEMHMVVELFGHQRISGKVTEQEIAVAGFVRVDVPKTKRREGFTKFYGPKAIYGMTPVSEAVAAVMAERFQAEPVSEYELSLELQKLLPAAVEELDDDDPFYDIDVPEDDEPLDMPFGFGDAPMPDPPEPDETELIVEPAPAPDPEPELD